jgi:transcription elongation factor B subunit 1
LWCSSRRELHGLFPERFGESDGTESPSFWTVLLEKAMAAAVGHIKLISAEKQAFVVERRVAMVSGMIRVLLSSAVSGASRDSIDLPDISSATLERVIEYMKYKVAHTGSKAPIPEFVVAPDAALDLLVASNYLDL